MANRATKENVAAAHAAPNYEDALAIIEGRIANAKSAQSKASGEASQAWGSIEAMGINKRGAQAAAKIIAIEDEDELQDFLRSFSGLLAAAGVSIKQDLVDVAQGSTPPPVVPRAAKPEPQPGPPGDTDLAGDPPAGQNAAGATDEEPPIERPAKKGQKPKLSIVAAQEAARAHLGSKPAAPDALG
jgi:hypothetical protein